MELNDLKFRFWKSDAAKLFSEISESSFPRIEVSLEVSTQLDQYLHQAIELCTFYWDNAHPVLFRARKNDFGQLEKFKAANMGPPPSDQVSVGRAQLAGVSMLYLADTISASITEVRPDVGEYVTVGNFRIKIGNRLKVLDLTRFRSEVFTANPPVQSSLINISKYAFSAQVHYSDPRRYRAQAYFVQKIRDLGYDGIGYSSAVHDKGRCFAFFDSSHFKCTRTQLHHVNSVVVHAESVQFSTGEKQFIAKQKANRKSKKKVV